MIVFETIVGSFLHGKLLTSIKKIKILVGTL